MLSGCAGSGADRDGISAADANSPANLVDSFLIARGMEFSYGGSGRAGPQEIARLIQYDHVAMLAVISAARQPTVSGNLQAQRALKTLVDYTGANDLAPQAVAAAPADRSKAPPPPPP